MEETKNIKADIIAPTEHIGVLYTPGEVAQYLKVAKSTVYFWAQTGKIECHVLSRGKRKNTVRFDSQQIQNFILSKKVV
jgi:excisionase family DNA binding protein